MKKIFILFLFFISFSCDARNDQNQQIFSYKNYTIEINDDILKLSNSEKNTIFKYQNSYKFKNKIFFENDNFYFITLNGIVQSRKLKNGELNWFFEQKGTKEKAIGDILLQGNSVYIVYGDGELFKLHKSSGAIESNKNIMTKLSKNKNYISIIGFDDVDLSFKIREKKKSIEKKIKIRDLIGEL